MAAALLQMLEDIADIMQLRRRLVHLAMGASGEPISSQHWRCICQLQSLTCPKLSEPLEEGGTQDWTADISCLTNLRELWMDCGGPDLMKSNGLVQLTQLDQLHLREDLPADRLHNLSALLSLCALELSYSSGMLSVPLCLSGLQGLSKLECTSVILEDQVQAMADLTKLQHLHCSSVSFEHNSDWSLFFPALRKLTALTYLFLDNVEDGGEALDCRSVLAPPSKLVELHLLNVAIINFQASINLSALEQLTLFNNDLDDVPSLAGLCSLQECSISQWWLQIMQPLSFPSALRKLDLKNTSNQDWNGQSVVHLADAMNRASTMYKEPPLLILG